MTTFKIMSSRQGLESMRAVVQLVLPAVVATTAVLGGSPDVDPAAVSRPMSGAVESVAPTRDALVGVAHPVVVTFGGPIADRDAAEHALRIMSTPARTGRFEWLEDHVVQWIPDQFWPAHSTVTLSVNGKLTQFETGPAVVGIADLSDHTFTVTVDGLAAGSPIALPAPHHLPRLGEEGVLLATMGRPEYPTPVGTYSVLAKDDVVVMDSSSVGIPVTDPDGYLLEVEDAVRFTRRGLFVHSAPWAVGSLGLENVSHGCISLAPAAAQWYFDTVNIGDPVIVQE
jgi:lipoprotein-anchoring transpeptidase ErfK/SrfK